MGEMEISCLMSSNHDEEVRSFFKPQLGRYPYCRRCQLFADCIKKFVFCPRCKEQGDVAMMELSVATKLWMDQCSLLGIGFKICHSTEVGQDK